MNTVSLTRIDSNDLYEHEDVHARLRFFKHLQTITNQIHATTNVEQIMLDLSQNICDLFDCERLTLYVVNRRLNVIESKIKTGLSSFKDFALPISDKSIAGYVALSQKTISITNVYSESELRKISPSLEFLRRVDQRTGFKTREMMAGPLIHEQSNELLGVLQLINNRSRCRFSALHEEGFRYLRNTLAVAFAQRLMSPEIIHTKFESLIKANLISAPELVLAARAARRKGVDIEEILVSDFQIKQTSLGQALGDYFQCPYVSFQAGRERPEALKNFKRAYIEDNGWLILEEQQGELTVMTTDPEKIMVSHIVKNLFPIAKIRYCVTTQREFSQTVEQFFPGESIFQNTQTRADDIDSISAAERKLLDQVRQTLATALAVYPALRADVSIREDKTVSRLHKDGSVQKIQGQLIVNFESDFLDTGTKTPLN